MNRKDVALSSFSQMYANASGSRTNVNPDQVLTGNGSTNSTPEKSLKTRKSKKKACENCVRRRSRCDRGGPCKACILHNTQSTCHFLVNPDEKGGNVPTIINTRPCSNCVLRQRNCDQLSPCSNCISDKMNYSCFEEQAQDHHAGGPMRNDHRDGKAKRQTKKVMIPKDGLGELRTTNESRLVSNKACYNCWYRKTKCSKQKPCSFCVFHKTEDTCFIELDGDNSDAGREILQRMAAEKQARAKGRASLPSTSSPNWKSSSNTPPSNQRERDHSQPAGMFIYSNQDYNSAIELGNRPFYPTPIASTSWIPDSSSPYERAIFNSMSKLPPLRDLDDIFLLVGDVELGGEWPSVDHERVRATVHKIRRTERIEAMELAYVYALLAVCVHALPSLNRYKLTGQLLNEKNLQSFKDEAIRLTNLSDTVVKREQVIESLPYQTLFECRIFHALAWSHHYSQQAELAFHFSERSISCARSMNIIHGFSDSDELYNPAQRHFRNLCRGMVLELYPFAKAIQMSSFLPTSIPPLSADLQNYAKSIMEREKDLETFWMTFKVLSANHLEQSMRFIQKIGERTPDGQYKLSCEERDAITLSMLSKLENDIQEWDENARGMNGKIEEVLVEDDIRNAKLIRRNHIKSARHFGTNFFRLLYAASSFRSGSMNKKLLGIALDSVYYQTEYLPLFVDLQRSQFHFPPHRKQIRNGNEMAMKSVFDAICRIDDFQQDPILRMKMSKLLMIIPKTFLIMNNYGVTGPFSLAVASTFKPIPIKRPFAMIGDINSDSQIKQIANEDEEDPDMERIKNLSQEQVLYHIFLQQQLENLAIYERPTISSLLNPIETDYVVRRPRIEQRGHGLEASIQSYQ